MGESAAGMASIFDEISAGVLDAVAAAAQGAGRGLSDAVKFQVLAEAGRIAQENAGWIVDAASGRWIPFCALLLAAYRALAAATGDRETALAALTEAARRPFTRQIAAYLETRFGVTQDAPEEAFDRIAAAFKPRGEERFGATFTYVQAVQERDRSHIHITRCLFNDFFAANAAAEVTSVLCALDMIWADEVAQPRYGVRFGRPTTLAAGDDACRFEFARVCSASVCEHPERRPAVVRGP